MARKIGLPTTGPRSIIEEKKYIEEIAKKKLAEENRILRASWVFSKKVEISTFEKVANENGELLSNLQKKHLGEKEIFEDKGDFIFKDIYQVVCDNEGKMARYRTWVETVIKVYKVLDEDFKKEFLKERQDFFQKKEASLRSYEWSKSNQLQLERWIMQEKARCNDFKHLYDVLVEKSKTESLTSTRVREIKIAEEHFEEFGIPYTPWVQPELSKTFFRETYKGECFSEEDEDEILDKILGEWALSSADLDEEDKCEVSGGGVTFEVKFKNPYGFKIWVRGDVQLGVFALKRTGLKEIDE